MKPTQAQERHNAIEVLRNQLSPFKAYQVAKPTAPSANIITNSVNGHEVKFTFYYQPTRADMVNAHHATKHLENNLRNGVAIRKAHLYNLVENYTTTINSEDLKDIKHETGEQHELESN
jgi:hypothetical protein